MKFEAIEATDFEIPDCELCPLSLSHPRILGRRKPEAMACGGPARGADRENVVKTQVGENLRLPGVVVEEKRIRVFHEHALSTHGLTAEHFCRLHVTRAYASPRRSSCRSGTIAPTRTIFSQSMQDTRSSLSQPLNRIQRNGCFSFQLFEMSEKEKSCDPT